MKNKKVIFLILIMTLTTEIISYLLDINEQNFELSVCIFVLLFIIISLIFGPINIILAAIIILNYDKFYNLIWLEEKSVLNLIKNENMIILLLILIILIKSKLN